jgi:hypothetical protein
VPFIAFAAVAGGPVALVARLAHWARLWRAVRRASAAGLPLGAVGVPAETAPVAVAIGLGAMAALRWGTP